MDHNQILKRLIDLGFEAFLVGGAVRDKLINLNPTDWDVVTNATPKQMVECFFDRKVKTVGASFQVVLVDGIEVATYRSDFNAEGGRHACVTTVCETLREDLGRRDFTFNALALNQRDKVIDLFNGEADLKNRVVRFVGDPDERIWEDPLRMIRAARFASLIGGRLAKTTTEAIVRNRDLVKQISPERIRIELIKAMKHKRPSVFFDVLHTTGLQKILLPEVEALYGKDGGPYHNETLDRHVMTAGDNLNSSDPVLRLVGFLHDIGKPISWDNGSFLNHEKIGADIVELLFKRLKFSSKETERAKNLVRFHMNPISLPTKKSVRKLLKKFSENNVVFGDWLKLKVADKKANLANENYTRKDIKEVALKVYNAKKEANTSSGVLARVTDLNITGNDVMNHCHINPGQQVGRILKGLLDLVLEDPTLNKKETLLNLIEL